MDSGGDKSLPGFAWPQWIRKRGLQSPDFDDLCFSPPSDDAGHFVHWNCISKTMKADQTSSRTHSQASIMDSKASISVSVSTSSPSCVTPMKLKKDFVAPVGTITSMNLVDKVNAITPLSTPGASPFSTPCASPQSSPNINRRGYTANPYFVERENDGGSWLFRKPIKPEGYVEDPANKKQGLAKLQPAELREMNLFCPLSM